MHFAYNMMFAALTVRGKFLSADQVSAWCEAATERDEPLAEMMVREALISPPERSAFESEINRRLMRFGTTGQSYDQAAMQATDELLGELQIQELQDYWKSLLDNRGARMLQRQYVAEAAMDSMLSDDALGVATLSAAPAAQEASERAPGDTIPVGAWSNLNLLRSAVQWGKELKADLVSEPEEPNHQVRSDSSRYSLQGIHAEGSIGRVWLAQDVQLGRSIALKELRPEKIDDPIAQKRFLREAKITGQLEHPYIVPVHRLHTGPHPYYTMRLVRGRTLDAAIAHFHRATEAGTLPSALRSSNLLVWLIQVAQAVGFAHCRRVLHRDLKPTNVMVGDHGEVSVLDWGLARVCTPCDDDPDHDESTPVPDLPDTVNAGATMSGQVLGTPAYMSPEQSDGRTDLLDARSDIYGLGAIMYEILTGRSPHHRFDTSNPKKYFRQIQVEAIPAPRSLRDDVPRALEAICLKCLEKNPAERYPSTKELIEDIQHWLVREPVSAYREPPGQRVARYMIRHWRWSQAIVIGLILIIVTTTIMVSRAVERGRAMRQLELQNLVAETTQGESWIEHRVESLGDDAAFFSHLPATVETARLLRDPKTSPSSTATQQAAILASVFQRFLDDHNGYLLLTYTSSLSQDQPAIAVRRLNRDSGPLIASAYDRSLPSLATPAIVKEAMNDSHGKLIWSQPTVSTSPLDGDQMQVTVAVATSVHANGEVLGVIYLQLDLGTYILDVLKSANERGVFAYVVNSTGKILLRARVDGKLEINAESEIPFKGRFPKVQKFFDTPVYENIVETTNVDSEGDVVACAKIAIDADDPGNYLGIAMGASYEELLAESASERDRTLVLSLVVMAIAVAGSLAASRLIARMAHGSS